MKKFLDKDFLLNNKKSRDLYHNYAEKMPIFDYHCHLNPKDIAEDRKFKNLFEIWLEGDHYKWRAMRSNGIKEKYITGNAEDYEKYLAFVETLDYCYGNPLYHWSHLELKRYFGIEENITKENALIIWEKVNKLLQSENFSARKIIQKSNVKEICTTDDPIDDLKYHKIISEDKTFNTKVMPTFRADILFKIENEVFFKWLEKLGKITNVKIDSVKKLIEAIEQRIKYFKQIGCVVSDISIEKPFFSYDLPENIEILFQKLIYNKNVSFKESDSLKTYFLIQIIKLFRKYNLVLQLHIGAMRNNNTKMLEKLGENIGMDSIGDYTYAIMLSKLLDHLNRNDEIPRTIIYCLNPKDNEVFASMIGNFQNDEFPSKLQFGAAWWFLDQKDGIIKQLKTLSNFGLLRRFIGMLTDSRSFLSYTRHEYFRRILCDMIGKWVENGEIPDDENILKKMIEEICYLNAKKYFSLDN